MTALFLLSKFKDHKRIMAVVMILSAVLPLLVMTLVGFKMTSRAVHRAEINSEREAIMARREAIIDRNEEAKAAVYSSIADSTSGMEPIQITEFLVQDDGWTSLAERTADYIQNIATDYFDPVFEQMADLAHSIKQSERAEE